MHKLFEALAMHFAFSLQGIDGKDDGAEQG